MDDLNPSLTTPLKNPIENTPIGKPASKLYYLILGILVISLGASLFFLNTSYQKAQTLGTEVIKLSADITIKDTLIASLNASITNLKTELQASKDNTASGTAHTTSNPDTSSGLESYLKKSRDTARISHLMQFRTALSAYILDKGSYPIVPKSGCMPSDELSGGYIPTIPVDPIVNRHSSGCDSTDVMTYAYRTINNHDGIASIIIAVELESETLGNSALTIDEIMALEDPVKETYENLKQGSGKYYIMAY